MGEKHLTCLHTQQKEWIGSQRFSPVWAREPVALTISCSASPARIQDLFWSPHTGNPFCTALPFLRWFSCPQRYALNGTTPGQCCLTTVSLASLWDDFSHWNPWYDSRATPTPSENHLGTPTRQTNRTPYLPTKENTKSTKSLKPPFRSKGDSKRFMQPPIRNSFCGMFHIPTHGLFPHISPPVISTRCGKAVCAEL